MVANFVWVKMLYVVTSKWYVISFWWQNLHQKNKSLTILLLALVILAKIFCFLQD